MVKSIISASFATVSAQTISNSLAGQKISAANATTALRAKRLVAVDITSGTNCPMANGNAAHASANTCDGIAEVVPNNKSRPVSTATSSHRKTRISAATAVDLVGPVIVRRCGNIVLDLL